MAKLRDGTRIYGSSIINDQAVIGSATSTGTADQNLNVFGGAYISGKTGIGSTNPSHELTVVGDIKVSQDVIANTYYGSASTLTDIPAYGLDGQVQYNVAGLLKNAPYFYFDISTNYVGVGTSSPAKRLDVTGPLQISPGTSVTPTKNGDVVFEFTNNTTITIRAKGTDGTVRSGIITLS